MAVQASPLILFTGTSGETEAGKWFWNGGRGLRERHSCSGSKPSCGGGVSPGPRPAPQLLSSATPTITHSSRRSPPVSRRLVLSLAFLPFSLYVSFLALRSLPPFSVGGCLCVYLYLSVSISVSVSVPGSLARSLFHLAHFPFLSLSVWLSFLPPFSPPSPPTHTSQSCLRHPQGWQVGGAAAERG